MKLRLILCVLLWGCASTDPSSAALTLGVGQGGLSESKSGAFVFNLRGEPSSLHPLLSTDLFAHKVHEYTMDSLAGYNPSTGDLEPRLAEKWQISKDHRQMTFHLRKEALFHDGQPVTAEDVKFSFDAIMDPKYEADAWRSLYENIESAEVIDAQTIRFVTKNSYYKNFDQVATMFVLPKHVYGDVAKSKKLKNNLIGAGPYQVSQFMPAEKIVMKRFATWYGFKHKPLQGRYNFEVLEARFIYDEGQALELMKKGELHFSEMRADAYQLKAVGEPWGSRIIKVKYENREPKNWYFYGWNMEHPILKSRNVRLALTHLMDREAMIKKFLFGYAKPAAAPVWHLSDNAPVGVKPLLFNPEKAIKLLKEDGWVDTDENGILDKIIGGVKTELSFTLLHANRDYEKYHAWFQEDLREAGIVMNLKLVDWKTLESELHNGRFDAVAMGWGGGDLEPDPKAIWHSNSIGTGSNFVGYRNPEVDKLIDEARMETKKEKRIRLFRKAYGIIALDVPYTPWFDVNYEFYGVSAEIQRSSDSLGYQIGLQTWSKRK